MLLNSKSVLGFMPGGLGKFGKLAQVGVDLSVCHITKIVGGKITQTGKDIVPYEEVKSYKNEKGIKTWILPPGVYSLTFNEDIKLDNKHAGFVIGRSTCNRVGTLIRSAVFDSGFECSNVGANLYNFDTTIEIEDGARLAQLILFECQEAEAYQGSYFGNKDLK